MTRRTNLRWFHALALALVLALPACSCGGGDRPFGAACSTSSDCASGLACGPGNACAPAFADGGLVDGGYYVDGGRVETDAGAPDGGCKNLQCHVSACPGAGSTTLTGSVYDPSGRLPLYNAIVYVPNETVSPLPQGSSCDRCGSLVTGSPVAITLTGPDGKFTLDKVPDSVPIPLVMQIGKWRRQVMLPPVSACSTHPLTDTNVTRMPRNKAEGDLPQYAIATGSADPFECLLLKMGIDPAEFTVPGQGGRVSLYHANGQQPPSGAPDAGALTSSASALAQNDVVLLPCEGTEFPKAPPDYQNVVDYADRGGRLFLTHFSYVWTDFAPAPFPSTALWMPDPKDSRAPPIPFYVSVNQAFPKGLAFDQWLANVGALDGGFLGINESRHDVFGVNPDAGTSAWLSAANPNDTGQLSVQHLTFNTPVGPPTLPDGGAPEVCGRVLFSDFHVTTDALVKLADGGVAGTGFPAVCKAGDFTPQEKALVFMLFDVSSCVQSDTVAPTVCPTVGTSCSTSNPCCSGLSCDALDGTACAPGATSCQCAPPLH